LFHKLKVFFCTLLNGYNVSIRYLTNHSTWDAHDQRTRGNGFSLAYQSARSNDALFTDHGPRQDDGMNAHERPIADGARVQTGLVANNTVIAYDARLVVVGVHDASVLNTGSFTDVDFRYVGP
jgi:hypothetical protein